MSSLCDVVYDFKSSAVPACEKSHRRQTHLKMKDDVKGGCSATCSFMPTGCKFDCPVLVFLELPLLKKGRKCWVGEIKGAAGGLAGL